jgi:N-acetyl-alpha-D-muramate 1-phosphate uridylyltransferase
MRAMILAAGRGSRMRPLTDHTPKPLLKAGGKPLIVHHLEHLAAAGFSEVVINHAYLGAQIEQTLGNGSAWGLSIEYSREAEALETAGGVAAALPLLGDAPFLVISGDIYVEADYRQLSEGLLAENDAALACLWMVDNPSWHAAGDFGLVDGLIQLDGNPKLTYANIGVFQPAFFASVPAGASMPMLPLFKQAIARRQLAGRHFSGVWDNIGTPAQLAQLDAYLNESHA